MRRCLKSLACLVAVALGFGLPVAEAQSPKLPRVGYIIYGEGPGILEDGFVQGLRELGYEPGRSIEIEYRATAGRPERLPALVAELVALKVDVLVTGMRPALKRITTVPIVMPSASDPVGDGWIESLARPGGTVTGQSVHAPDLTPKRLELLRDALPGLTRVAVVWNVNNPPTAQLREADAAGRALGLKIDSMGVEIPDGLDQALARAASAGAGAAFFVSDIAVLGYRAEIGAAALRHRLPTLMSNKAYLTQGGGLMSYGPDIVEIYRRAAAQVGKILKGANPATLPVEQPTTFELAIDLRAAKALGIEVPPGVLVQADHLIE